MSLRRLQKALTEPFIDPLMTDRELLELILKELKEQKKGKKLASQKEYAEANGIHRTTVYRRKNSLRIIGAAEGEGKLTRYRLDVEPGGKMKI